MKFIKCLLSLFLFFTGYCFADAESSEMAKVKISADSVTPVAEADAKMAGASLPSNGNMTDGYNPSHVGNFGISGRNQLLAKISYAISLILCAATLVVFFIARLNAKKNYAKAKKFLMIGLALFAIAIATFFLPKMFLSTSFPGNFDMRAT